MEQRNPQRDTDRGMSVTVIYDTRAVGCGLVYILNLGNPANSNINKCSWHSGLLQLFWFVICIQVVWWENKPVKKIGEHKQPAFMIGQGWRETKCSNCYHKHDQVTLWGVWRMQRGIGRDRDTAAGQGGGTGGQTQREKARMRET
jgi:hypothetical protein